MSINEVKFDMAITGDDVIKMLQKVEDKLKELGKVDVTVVPDVDLSEVQKKIDEARTALESLSDVQLSVEAPEIDTSGLDTESLTSDLDEAMEDGADVADYQASRYLESIEKLNRAASGLTVGTTIIATVMESAGLETEGFNKTMYEAVKIVQTSAAVFAGFAAGLAVLIPLLQSMGIASAAAFGPIGIAVGAVVAISAACYQLYKNVTALNPKIQEQSEKLKELQRRYVEINSVDITLNEDLLQKEIDLVTASLNSYNKTLQELYDVGIHHDSIKAKVDETTIQVMEKQIKLQELLNKQAELRVKNNQERERAEKEFQRLLENTVQKYRDQDRLKKETLKTDLALLKAQRDQYGLFGRGGAFVQNQKDAFNIIGPDGKNILKNGITLDKNALDGFRNLNEAIKNLETEIKGVPEKMPNYSKIFSDSIKGWFGNLNDFATKFAEARDAANREANRSVGSTEGLVASFDRIQKSLLQREAVDKAAVAVDKLARDERQYFSVQNEIIKTIGKTISDAIKGIKIDTTARAAR